MGADWCGHCKQFAPSWDKLAQELEPRTFPDLDGRPRKVKAIKVNCVDFREICRQRGVQAFPQVNLYKEDGTFSRFEGFRSRLAIVSWVENKVKHDSWGWSAHHYDEHGHHRTEGCKVDGSLQVPKVPGRLELTAGNSHQDLDPTMTNVSHFVHHLAFEDVDRRGFRKAERGLPKDAVRHTRPIDGQPYPTSAYHQAFEHHLVVVGTMSSTGTAYQFVHSGRVTTVAVTEVPQVRFHFDIDAFAIQIVQDPRPVFQFVVSLMALLGGTYSVMRLLAMSTLSVSSVFSKYLQNAKASKGLLL